MKTLKMRLEVPVIEELQWQISSKNKHSKSTTNSFQTSKKIKLAANSSNRRKANHHVIILDMARTPVTRPPSNGRAVISEVISAKVNSLSLTHENGNSKAKRVNLVRICTITAMRTNLIRRSIIFRCRTSSLRILTSEVCSR